MCKTVAKLCYVLWFTKSNAILFSIHRLPVPPRPSCVHSGTSELMYLSEDFPCVVFLVAGAFFVLLSYIVWKMQGNSFVPSPQTIENIRNTEKLPWC